MARFLHLVALGIELPHHLIVAHVWSACELAGGLVIPDFFEFAMFHGAEGAVSTLPLHLLLLLYLIISHTFLRYLILILGIGGRVTLQVRLEFRGRLLKLSLQTQLIWCHHASKPCVRSIFNILNLVWLLGIQVWSRKRQR